MMNDDIDKTSMRLDEKWNSYCDQWGDYESTDLALLSLLETMKITLVELLKMTQDLKARSDFLTSGMSKMAGQFILK